MRRRTHPNFDPAPLSCLQPKQRTGTPTESGSIPHTAITLSFEFLDYHEVGICTGVNKLFKSLAYTAPCWQCLDISKVKEKHYLEYISFVGSLRPRIKSLHVCISDSEMFILEWLLKCCDTTGILKANVKFLNMQEAFVLKKSRIIGEESDDFVDLSSDDNDEIIRIRRASVVRNRAHSYLLNACEIQLTTFGHTFTSSFGLDLLCARCPNISDLSCSCTSALGYGGGFQSKDLKCLGKLRLKNLSILCSAEFCCFDFLAFCPHLENLVVSSDPPHTTRLSLQAPNLKTIDFRGMAPGAMLMSIDCPKLELIMLYHNSLKTAGFMFRTTGLFDEQSRYMDASHARSVLDELPFDELRRRMVIPVEGVSIFSPVEFQSVSPRFRVVFDRSYIYHMDW